MGRLSEENDSNILKIEWVIMTKSQNAHNECHITKYDILTY